MANWRVAKSILLLIKQANEMFPQRRHDSDGTIGDASHSARSSDHNPDTDGVVKAGDLSHDPAHGCNSYTIAQQLIDSRDPRIKYVISNYRICSGDAGPQPWVWRPYKVPPNKNPHDHHCHVSVKKDRKFYDDETPWRFGNAAVDSQANNPKDAPPAPETTLEVPETLWPMRNMQGDVVKQCQTLLGFTGTDVSGIYDDGPTERAVRALQKRNKLIVDGVCGPQTWKLLLA